MASVAGEVPFRAFRYAPVPPFHLSSYGEQTKNQAPGQISKASTKLSFYWLQEGDHFNATLKLLAMKNVGDLAENEVSLIHATSLNKKTGNVIPSQMRHTQKPLLAPVHRCSSTPWRLLTGQ
ncbi:MAG: hypothetical protein QNL01_13465 [Akkermansiaceae bacterium]